MIFCICSLLLFVDFSILLLHPGFTYLQCVSRFRIYSLMFLTEAVVNGIQVWRFFITFADVLGLPSFTLDEFLQALHDYVSFRYSQSCWKVVLIWWHDAGSFLPWQLGHEHGPRPFHYSVYLFLWLMILGYYGVNCQMHCHIWHNLRVVFMCIDKLLKHGNRLNKKLLDVWCHSWI